MPTVVGTQLADGVVLAGDRFETRDGQLVSEDCQRVFAFDDAAVGVSGAAGDVQALVRQLTDERRQYEHRQGQSPTATAMERLVSELAEEVGSPALVAARDDNGRGTLARIDADGGTTREQIAAIGTGEAIAVGLLEGMDLDVAVARGQDRLESILRTVAERDTETGEHIDAARVMDHTA